MTPDEQRHRLKLIAMIASIGGAVALTVLGAAYGWVLWRGFWPVTTAAARIDWLGWGMLTFAAGSVLITFSLGFVISRRKLKIGKDGLEGSGGDDDENSG